MHDIEAIYANIPGGRDLLAWFGRVPSFHDAEILSLSLHRVNPSTLCIHTWNTTPEIDENGYFVLDKHAVVTFAIEDILDVRIDSFSQWNIIFGLDLRRAPERPDRAPFYLLEPSPDDYEIELDPSLGAGGTIRCRRVSVTFAPGKPPDANV